MFEINAAALGQNNVSKAKSNDVGWEYGSLVDASNKNKVKCLLCNLVINGGVFRLKKHVAHVGNDVAKCKESSQEAKDKCKKSLEETSKKRMEKTANNLDY
jgi:hypothetical protein